MKTSDLFSIAIFCCLLVVMGCCKDKSPDPRMISGQANYTDPFSSKSKPLSGKIIKVSEVGSLVNFDLTTDTSGRFLLSGWTSDKGIIVKTKFIQNDSDEYMVVYSDSQTVSNGKISDIAMKAVIDKENYTGMLVSVSDTNSGKIAGAKVLLYTSKIIAEKDTGFVGYGAFASLTTNELGSCLAMQLTTDTIYMKSSFSIEGRIILKSKEINDVTLEKGKFKNDHKLKIN